MTFFSRSKLRGKQLLGRLAVGLLLGTVPSLTASPAWGAERITVSYGMLQHTISVDALESYAKTGQADIALMAYTRFIPPEHRAQLRHILTTPLPLDPQQTRQFLRTTAGKKLVRHLVTLIQQNTSNESVLAMRVALMQATAQPQGLTLLNVLKQFPNESMEIDLDHGIQLITAWQDLQHRTNQAIAQIHQQAQRDATLVSRNTSALSAELDQPGPFAWEQQTFTFTDRPRDRSILVDLYLPLIQAPRPVIVISHGLGSDRSTLAYLAQHLASYGFGVVVPEHPGSNWPRLQAFLAGDVGHLMLPQEFIDRPQDITYVLDQLERLSQPGESLQGRLNLNRIGMVGQSLGGYTVLALAGATPNFAAVGENCPSWRDSLNLSLVLQCQAQTLTQPDRPLVDPRVKAAIAISPIGSQIFGPESLAQIRLPVMMMAGSADTLAPPLAEQIQPFRWLTTADKYLAVVQGGNHYSSIVASEALSAGPLVARRYTAALSTAFMETYVADRPRYGQYLSAAYASAISQDSLPLSVVRSLSYPSLTQASSGFPLTNSLVALGVSVQALGLLYFVKTRNYSPSCDS